jgi:hypothetical protein
MSNTLLTDNGIIRFYDGTVIAIEDQEYSPDGINYWEKTFNPNTHLSTLDGVTEVEGHKFKRVKHSGDTEFQLPYRIVADGVEMRVLDNQLQYKLIDEDDTKWKDVYDLISLKGEDGEKGEQGIPGEGFHIDLYGYYQLRPDCTNTLGTSNCTSCNRTGSNTGEATTFMSLGDGVLVLTQALITAGTVTVDTVAYSHFSNDLITWVPLTGGIVDFEARYLATDGTGAVYTDMRTEDYYGSRGVVYICADGNWTVLTNVATPSYMVGERVGSTNIGFMDNFVDDTLTDFVPNTIGLNANGVLEVAEQSLDETALIQTVAGDGLEIPNPMDPIRVNSSDFIGFGLRNYVSTADSSTDIQVLIDDLIGDGTRIQTSVSVDGEVRNLLGTDVTELINNDSGLIAIAQIDTFYDLSVNLGNGLILDGGTPQAITINVDDLSLEVDASNLHIKAYASGNDGVMLQHLNPDIIWTNRGIGLDTANGLYARIDNVTIGYDGSGNLEVPLNSVTGDRLNDNVADNTRGLEVLNDLLVVKVDGTTIDFNGSGELEYIGLSGNVVSSIIPNLGGSVLDTVRDDVSLRLDDGTGTIANMTSDAGTDTVNISIDVDEAWLTAQIQSEITAGATVYWGVLERANGDTTTIEQYITGLNHVELDTWYNDTMVHSTHGLVLRAVSSETYRVIVDANGNLDTVSVSI